MFGGEIKNVLTSNYGQVYRLFIDSLGFLLMMVDKIKKQTLRAHPIKIFTGVDEN